MPTKDDHHRSSKSAESEAWETAYAKRREQDLQLWSLTEQRKYRDLRDKDGLSHTDAVASVSALRKPTEAARAAEYDRTHRPRFVLSPVTGHGGYV